MATKPPHLAVTQAATATLDQDTRPANGSYEPPNSQSSNATSSTFDSIQRQMPPSSSDLSQASSVRYQYTPLSSQEHNILGQQSLPFSQNSVSTPLQRPITPSTQPDNGNVTTGSRNSTPSSGISGSPTYGSKRTASGTVKSVNAGGLNGLSAFSKTGHSRNISVDTNGSHVSQLAAQLKTGLSYAMVKVQNGWETRSIDEVEHLAVHMTSPSSATGTSQTPRATFQSPRAAIANSQRRSRDLSAATQQDAALSFPPWGQPPPARSTPQEGSQSIPTLAPAPEIGPSRIRRTHPSAVFSPPTLTTAGFSPPKHHPPTSYASSPQTPTSRPSQKAEQDAIDTLLFMSSPANSDAYPRARHTNGNGATAHSSPLRSNLPRTTLFGEQTGGSAYLNSAQAQDQAEKRAAKRRSLGIARTEREVESMLDAMGARGADGDVSSDEDVVLVQGRGVVDVRN